MIPVGTFAVHTYLSPNHHEIRPWIEHVPGREDIEMHVGNWPRDSKGCILVGQGRSATMITGSKLAFDHLMKRLAGQTNIRLTVKAVE